MEGGTEMETLGALVDGVSNWRDQRLLRIEGPHSRHELVLAILSEFEATRARVDEL